MLYRASENGFCAKKFHEKCDGTPNTLTVIQTGFNNNKIGGFTPLEWGAFNINMLLTVWNNHSFFLWLTTKSSLWYSRGVQSTMIRFMALHLEGVMICMFLTSQIRLAVASATSILVIRTITTKAKTVQRGRDSMVVQQIHIISRQ